MKKIELQGIGVHIEIYRRSDKLDDYEILKESLKTLQREVIKYEARINNNLSRSNADNVI